MVRSVLTYHEIFGSEGWGWNGRGILLLRNRGEKNGWMVVQLLDILTWDTGIPDISRDRWIDGLVLGGWGFSSVRGEKQLRDLVDMLCPAKSDLQREKQIVRKKYSHYSIAT